MTTTSRAELLDLLPHALDRHTPLSRAVLFHAHDDARLLTAWMATQD